jgi:hypothetical protein
MCKTYAKFVRTNLSLKIKILLGALVFVSLSGIGMVTYAASGNNSNKQLPNEMTIFDPFTLRVVTASSESTSSPISSHSSVTAPAENIISPSVLDSLIKDSTESAPSRIGMGNVVLSRSPIRIPCRPVLRTPFRPQ